MGARALASAEAFCYTARMRTVTRLVAAMQLALILPAMLFLTAVLVGTGDPPQYEFAHIAQRIVLWYQVQWKLWVLLLALPLAGLVAGCATLLRNWNGEAELPHSTRPSLATIPAPLSIRV